MKTRQGSVTKKTSQQRSSNGAATFDAIIESADSHEMADFGILLLALQERIQQRLASDLHDSTCQHLIAASLNLMRVRRAVSHIAGADRICDDIDASIEQALQELRAFSYLSYPQDLLSNGLKATIEQFVSGFSARTSLKVSLEIAPEIDRLPCETHRSLLSVIQEALSNVFRHAKATRVEIRMQAAHTHFLLRISDDGRGMPTDRERIPFGVGIPGMRVRLRQMGGALEYHSSSATECRGTTLCATIPRFFRGRQKSSFTCLSRISQRHTGRRAAKSGDTCARSAEICERKGCVEQ